MSSTDEISSLSQPTRSATIGKIHDKMMMLVSRACNHDYIGGKNIAAAQIELSSDRKKCQGQNLVHQTLTFKTMLENLRMN